MWTSSGSGLGFAYTSYAFAQVLDDHAVPASIGSVGDALDNALAESFVDSFKTELIADRVRRSRSQLEQGLDEALGFAVGARPVGPGGEVLEPEFNAGAPMGV